MDKMDSKVLLGVNKKSFSMFFGGGEIWFEHLDGLYAYSELAIEKLENDYQTFKSPSSPSLIAVNIDETTVTQDLIAALKETLLNGQKRFTRVVFVGANWQIKCKLRKSFAGAPFALNFLNDFEKAKEWLVTETVR